MKVIKITPKISVKIILVAKTVILNPKSKKINKSQTIVGFGCKILKFCLRIKTFLQMLEKEVFLQNLARWYWISQKYTKALWKN